jgi:hypothetical protein
VTLDLIECASYVCGGYYSAFKDLLKAGKHMNVGFPIAEIDHKGECILTKERNTGGCITVGSVTSQLLYEIQGPLYYNSDVVAQLEDIQMEQVGEDKVRIWGVKGLPPPPTTRIRYRIPLIWSSYADYDQYHCSCRLPSRISCLSGRLGYRRKGSLDGRTDPRINRGRADKEVLDVKVPCQRILPN